MSKLKPCPFCGKYPQTVVDDETEEKFGVKCFNCGGSIDTEKETLREAIEAWNRRASIEPERKKGKWIHKKITEDLHVTGQCSVCKERRIIDNYCPNCGSYNGGEEYVDE